MSADLILARNATKVLFDMISQDNVYETLDRIIAMTKRQDDTQYQIMNYQ
jgi:hypothetical protein